jgi:hypothetical protein
VALFGAQVTSPAASDRPGTRLRVLPTRAASSATLEELVTDFGLNSQMRQVPTEVIKLSTRLVMNFHTAK